MWRLVLDEKATLSEIDRHWSLSDVLDANEALDVANDAAELGKPSAPPPPPARPPVARGTAIAKGTRPPPPRRR